MSDLSQGLIVSVLGISITFLALALFILVMVVLQKLFPYKDEKVEALEEVGTPAGTIEIVNETVVEEEEVAAAVAVALAYFKQRRQSQLGAALAQGHSAWWSAHRAAANQGILQKN